MKVLTFSELRAANIDRCEDAFHPVNDWSLTDWGCATAGEVGEGCNLIKKARRGEHVSADAIADEFADTVIYADLLCARLGVKLEDAVRRKFNAVSERCGSRERL